MPSSWKFAWFIALALPLAAAGAGNLRANEPQGGEEKSIHGVYLESRTCQVYTGPCFANGEIGLAGKEALLAWGIESGQHGGVDLSGLNVVMVLAGSDTLAFRGIEDAQQLRSVILVDERATGEQRDALAAFAKSRTGKAGEAVTRVIASPISVSLDLADISGELQAGNIARLTTRKARAGDCICSNEVAYYPPLTQLENFVPAVALEGEFSGKGLGVSWSTPQSRSAYVGLFNY